jgi:hypothetical protein
MIVIGVIPNIKHYIFNPMLSKHVSLEPIIVSIVIDHEMAVI